jgi:hypothetical protein
MAEYTIPFDKIEKLNQRLTEPNIEGREVFELDRMFKPDLEELNQTLPPPTQQMLLTGTFFKSADGQPVFTKQAGCYDIIEGQATLYGFYQCSGLARVALSMVCYEMSGDFDQKIGEINLNVADAAKIKVFIPRPLPSEISEFIEPEPSDLSFKPDTEKVDKVIHQTAQLVPELLPSPAEDLVKRLNDKITENFGDELRAVVGTSRLNRRGQIITIGKVLGLDISKPEYFSPDDRPGLAIRLGTRYESLEFRFSGLTSFRTYLGKNPPPCEVELPGSV